MLPYVEGDRQQLQRKRHIGNDIVAIVFQDEETPFVPNMITSHFLHAYIVIQPIDPCTENCRYKVSVTCRVDVPEFEPPLPNPSVFAKDDNFREWLYCKLMNAEWACYKSEQFAKLQYRTRSMLLDQLYDEINRSTELMLGVTSQSADTISMSSTSSDTTKDSAGIGFFEAFKRLTRNRRSSDETNSNNSSPPLSQKKPPKPEVKSNNNGSSGNDVDSRKSKKKVLERSVACDEVDEKRPAACTRKHSNDSGHQAASGDIKSQAGSTNSLNYSPQKQRQPSQSYGSFTSLDSDLGTDCNSNNTDSLPRRQNTRIDDCDDDPTANGDTKFPNSQELDVLKTELEKLRTERSEYHKQEKEIETLRSEIKRLKEVENNNNNKGSNNNHHHRKSIKIPDDVIITEEHLV